MKKLFFVVFSLILSSCNLIDFNNKGFIDPKLKPYVDSFFHEAEIRGIYFDKTNLIVKVSRDIGSKSGLSEVIRGQRIVSINSYLIEGNNLRLQIIVFHELGHAMGRHHFDNKPSIMNTSPCINCDIDNYYLDELFYGS